MKLSKKKNDLTESKDYKNNLIELYYTLDDAIRRRYKLKTEKELLESSGNVHIHQNVCKNMIAKVANPDMPDPWEKESEFRDTRFINALFKDLVKILEK